MDKKVQKMCFSWKKSKFWIFFLYNSKNLKLGEKQTNKQKTVPRDKYALHKSNNLDFPWPVFKLFDWKNCQKPSKLWSKKKCWFSKNSDIFLHLMLLLLLLPLFLNLQWKYVLQITDKHLFTMSNTIYILIF